MLTNRDNEITKHFEKYFYGTIPQIEKLFFRDVSSSYVVANRRLNELTKAGYIKPLFDRATNRNVYVLNDKKVKPPSLHRLLALDVYAELAYYGYDVECFKCEKQWAEGKYRSDAFVIFTVADRKYRFFIEIQIANPSHDPNILKYDELFKTGEVQKELKTEYYPRILLVSDINYKVNCQFSKVTSVKTNLSQLSKILI